MTLINRPTDLIAGPRPALPTASPQPVWSGYRPPSPTAIERRLRGPAGFVLARPWLDRVTALALRHLFFPLSRLWAAAHEADGRPDRFFDAVPMRGRFEDADRLRAALAKFEAAHAAAAAIEAIWERAFFGPADPGTDRLLAIEAARRHARHQFNATRGLFLFLVRRKFSPVKLDIASPDAVAEIYGPALADLAPFTAPPAVMPRLERSRAIPGAVGRQFWIRFPSPAARLGDTAWARIYEPEGVADAPTVIFGHGVCVEYDHWEGMIDDAASLCARGLRVIRPEAPWHGRRCPPGAFGGERVIGSFPLGPLDSFLGAMQEWAVLADWARATSRGALAMGGSSLGALTAQLAADRARDWPERLRPEALLLVTHCGRFLDTMLEGELGSMFGSLDDLRPLGWTPERAGAYMGLIDPARGPVVPGDRIVSVLGNRDRITPFPGGLPLIDRWAIPPENAFIWNRGHFTVPMSLLRNPAPLDRFAALLRARPHY